MKPRVLNDLIKFEIFVSLMFKDTIKQVNRIELYNYLFGFRGLEHYFIILLCKKKMKYVCESHTRCSASKSSNEGI